MEPKIEFYSYGEKIGQRGVHGPIFSTAAIAIGERTNWSGIRTPKTLPRLGRKTLGNWFKIRGGVKGNEHRRAHDWLETQRKRGNERLFKRK